MPRAAAAAACLLAACVSLSGCGQGTDDVIVGRFSPDEPVSLTNLTVADGRYLVTYALEVYIDAPLRKVDLTCGVVDTTGRIAQLPGLVRTVSSGQWLNLFAEDVFELPDLTMGIRCYPNDEVSLQVVVRRVELAASPIS